MTRHIDPAALATWVLVMAALTAGIAFSAVMVAREIRQRIRERRVRRVQARHAQDLRQKMWEMLP